MTNKQITMLIERYPSLSVCEESIMSCYDILKQAYSNGQKLLVCGNGGSASDSEHIVGEMMKEFKLKRRVYKDQAEAMKRIDPELGEVLAKHLQGALPAISLTGHSSLTTAFMNDSNPELIFAQQVNGYGKPDDVFLGISTSGNSHNVLFAAVVAKAKGLKVIGLTGQKPCRLASLADVCIQVPETETYKIQELHLPVYHCLCMMLEEHFFGSNQTLSSHLSKQ
ncbi:MAG: SIS domain-containing protein [Prevotella sp.]|jgi:D-sedoheptulose 7-phosphate isomerase|nr:SIS domain-containing protein [Prevotella sp.]